MSRRLTRRTWAALAILLLAIPALMAVFVCVWDERKYYLTSLLLVGLMFVPFALRFEGRRPQARDDDGTGRGRARGVLLAAAV